MRCFIACLMHPMINHTYASCATHSRFFGAPLLISLKSQDIMNLRQICRVMAFVLVIVISCHIMFHLELISHTSKRKTTNLFYIESLVIGSKNIFKLIIIIVMNIFLKQFCIKKMSYLLLICKKTIVKSSHV